MKFAITGIVLLASLFSAMPVMSASAPSASKSEVLRLIGEAASRPHPRLFANREQFEVLKARSRSEPLLKAMREKVLAQADHLLDAGTIEYKLNGRRWAYAYEACSRPLVLAMAFRLSGNRKFLDRAVREMKALGSLPNWNPDHYLDTAIASLGYATAYDWLYDEMPAADREEVRAGFVKNGYSQMLAGGFWVTIFSNWGQVCNGGALVSALAMIDSDPKGAAEIICRSVSGLPCSMKHFAPHGAYPEGPGYWGFGTGYNTVGIAALDSVLGKDFGLSQQEGFLETGNFIEYATGPSGEMFNFSDSGSARSSNYAVWWFAHKLGKSELLNNREISVIGEDLKYPRYRVQLLPLIMLIAPSAIPQASIDLPLSWNSQGDNPFVVQRSGWGKDDFFVGIKAGHPGYSHGHQDAGSFVMDAGGVRWADDLGPNDYFKAEQVVGSKEFFASTPEAARWKIFRNSVKSHNTLMIGGSDQVVFADAVIKSVSEGPESEAVIDLTANYPMAKVVVRTGKMLPGGRKYRLVDQIDRVKAGTEIRWAMITRAEVSEKDDTLTLRRNGRVLKIRRKVSQTPSPWKIEHEPKGAEWEDDNPGTTQISFTVEAPEKGGVKIAVGFVLTK